MNLKKSFICNWIEAFLIPIVSKTFINGILDKLITDLKRDGKIEKTGRGLME